MNENRSKTIIFFMKSLKTNQKQSENCKKMTIFEIREITCLDEFWDIP